MSKKTFFITTPIYYVNDRPHVGHTYTTLIADVLSRYHRLYKKEKTFFLTGTDEHGGKIEKVAKLAGKDPKQFCDENSLIFKKAWQSFKISYDNFIRTTDLNHIRAVQNALNFLYKKNFIYKGIYEGLYCLGCEQYKTKDDLVDGKCPDHKTEPELIKEESYLFRLSAFTDILEKKIREDKLKIEPEERKNEVLSFLKMGLRDISVSREKVEWGIPLPFDKRFTCYVWLDALLNYLTGLGWKGDPKIVPDFWPPNLQLMSKDIVRIHATVWPALLLALKIPLPKQIFSHGYFTVNNQKMSKSLGNVIWPEDLIKKFGVDGSRYLLISSLSYGQDGDISWEKLIKKYNADLAGGLGNLVARVVALAKNQGVQNLKRKTITKNSELNVQISKTWKSYHKTLTNFNFNDTLAAIWSLIGFCNKYIEKEKPWDNKNQKLKAKNKKVISDLLFVIVQISEMLKPFLPQASEKILVQLKTKSSKSLFPRFIH
jgi:methionyl-tRNA synthetase